MNAKAKGTRFENKVKKELEQDGWFVARQARSKFPDLIALNKINSQTHILWIECKYNKYIKKPERIMLRSYERTYGGKAIIAYNRHGKTMFCNVEYKEISITRGEKCFST